LPSESSKKGKEKHPPEEAAVTNQELSKTENRPAKNFRVKVEMASSIKDASRLGGGGHLSSSRPHQGFSRSNLDGNANLPASM